MRRQMQNVLQLKANDEARKQLGNLALLMAARGKFEVVLSYWKDISHGLKPRKNLRGDPRRITKTRKICGTAVSKLHGRAPNPRARQRGGRAPVEVGDFPFLESIFMIFGKLSGLFPDNRPLRAISRRNDQRLPKSAPKILTNHRNDSKTTCRQPPRARGPPPAESGGLARPRSLGWYSNHQLLV